MKRDALRGWRDSTRQLGLPLHCHYSGIWDAAAGAKHPEWGAVTVDGKPAGAAFGPDPDLPGPPQRMCPRGPYLERLLIPQMMELIDRYGVDGFWVDGEIWACTPCYCQRCTSAFKEATSGTRKVQFIEINLPASFYEKFPYYAPSVVPVTGNYPGAANKADVPSFGVKATFVTSATIPEAHVYGLVKEIFEDFDNFKKLHPAYAVLTKANMLEGLSAPLHPGAEKYYKEAGLM